MALIKQPPSNKAQHLKLFENIPFFDLFEPAEKKEFASSDNFVVQADKDTKIVEQGSIDYSAYILLEGSVIVTKNESPRLVVSTLHPGAVFGEVSFLNRCPRPVNIIAREKVKALRLNGDLFDKLSHSTQIKLKDKFIDILINRIEDMNQSMISLKAQLDEKDMAGKQLKYEFQDLVNGKMDVNEVIKIVSDKIKEIIR